MQKFFTTLSDMSFKKFITPQIIGQVYVIGIAFVLVQSMLLLRFPFGFIIAPISFVAAVVLLRCALEMILAVFQIARYSAEIARRGRPLLDGESASDDPLSKGKAELEDDLSRE
jgi:hypothetical protein